LAERARSRGDAAGRGVLLLFLDGVGLGDAVPERNPLAAAALPRLRELIGGAPVAGAAARSADGVVFRSLDARLGYEGLPQSATGQTSLLTGRNAAELMGRHYGPWPGPTLVRALQEGTLFHHANGAAALANAYPEGYFRAIESRRLRPNAPVTAARAAGVSLFGLDAYVDGEALSADITGLGFHEIDPELPRVTPEEAGRRLAHLAAGHAFTFYDVWLTDRYGHQQRHGDAVSLLEAIDGLIEGLLPELGDTTLVLTSDHGNLEDLASSHHTRNPVPLLAVGPGAEAFSAASELMDVYGGVREVLAGI
jgi:2,3-bisphosphoglycerate-independent phosphoglycerate mutase